jgi:glycerate 2-kinase
MAAVSHSAQGDGARSCGAANSSMKKIVIAPDSFKGSLAAIDVARAIAAGLHRVWPAAACVLVPMADGGEGTLDAVLSAGGERRQTEVRGAAGDWHAAAFGIVEREGRPLAIIEIAQVVGITEPSGMAAPVGSRSTQGVGELMRHVLDLGVRDFLIGLGGSSTNDGGAGLLTGLGVRLVGEDQSAIPPQAEALVRVRQVDVSALDPRLATSRITIMSDVNNPLTGPRGATAIFGPQKGVTPDLQERYDSAIAAFARLAEDALGRRAADNPGAGAAGGLGFALQLLGGEFRSGAEVIADLLRLDDVLAGADWLITGEGRSDMQTLLGKTPQVVARRAALQRVPATLLSGGIDRAALPALGETFAGCFSLVFGPMTLAAAIADSTGLLADSAEQMARLLQSAWRSRAMTRA